MRESAAKVELNALKKAEAEEIARRIEANKAYSAKANAAVKRWGVTNELLKMQRHSLPARVLAGARDIGLFFKADKIPGAQQVYNTLAGKIVGNS
jgi:hypothetical protein